MGYCLNNQFKQELMVAFDNTYRVALKAEKAFTKKSVVPIPRQLELAHLVARHINEGYYHRLPYMWVPYISTDLMRLPSGEQIIAIEIFGVHKAGFGLWN